MIKSLGPGLDSLDFLRIALGNQHLFIVIQNSNLSKPLVLTWPQLLQQIQNQINIVGGVSSVNGQTGVVVLSLDDLSDVNAPSPSVNQILQWNGTAWVPATISTGIYTADNGLTPEFINPNNFQLGGSLIKSTIITSQQFNGAHNLRFDAPSAFINTLGAFQFTAITSVARSSTSVLASFRANDCITAYFETDIILGSSSTAVKIKSLDTLSVPLLIEGSLASNLLKVLDSGQLELAQYNTSTSFQGVSGTSVGILNVDNAGKVFVTPAPTGTGTVTSVGTAGLISGGPITTSGTITTSMNTNKLVGRGTAGVGVMEEITLGTGLSLTGTTLNATGGGGLLSGTATQVSSGVYTTTITGVTSYTAGDTYIIKFTTTNDGASTLNINSIGAINIFKNTNVPIASGDIKANQEIEVVYDGTNFQAIGLVSSQLLAYVHNSEGAIISKGQVVYAYQASGNKMSVKLARADSDATSAKTIGLVYDSSIGIGGEGYIIIQGVIEGINTAAFSAGDTLYLSGTTFGAATNVKPYAPIHLVYVGIVERANAGNGQIYVRCQNGYELDELHNVQAQSPSLKDTLWYDNTVSPAQWKTASVNTLLNTSIKTGSCGVTFDGGGQVVQNKTAYVQMPYSGTLGAWSMVADQAGACTITVSKGTFGTFPASSAVYSTQPAIPATNITATNAGAYNPGMATVTAGDVLKFEISAITAITWVNLSIQITKT